MMYVHLASLTKLKQDLGQFYQSSMSK